MDSKETYTIIFEPMTDGRVLVRVPEIDAQVIIDSTLRTAAIDAAHDLIETHWREQLLAAASAQAQAS